MKWNVSRSVRTGLAIGGVAVLAAIGFATPAAADEDVTVTVDISPNQQGSLSLSIAGNTVALTEQGTPTTVRTFTGTLPTVTVTDTRTAGQITPGSYWAVVGGITDFAGTAAQPDISSTEYFGWTPNVVAGNAGQVAPGDDIAPGTGFDTEPSELLTTIDESAPGSWQANAGLTLEAPATVASGAYQATLTLSLFEG